LNARCAHATWFLDDDGRSDRTQPRRDRERRLGDQVTD
jgi:hypothetical protein